MKQNREIPAYLMDWIENFDFQDLEEDKKIKVLEIVPESEYRQIRSAFLLVSMNSEKAGFPEVGDFSFPEPERSGLKSLLFKQLPFYKVAAVLFVAMAGAFLSGYFSNPDSGSGQEYEDSRNKARPAAETSVDSKSSAEMLAEGSRTLKEDTLAAIFITGIYK